jgi:hypothetical protein
MGKFIAVVLMAFIAVVALTNSTPVDDRISEDNATNQQPINLEVDQPEICECEALGDLEVCECADVGGELQAEVEIRELAQRELTMEEVVMLHDMTGAEYGM